MSDEKPPSDSCAGNSSESWETEEERIFATAIGCPDPLSRRVLLENECGGDQHLLHRVEALLSALDRANSDEFCSGGLRFAEHLPQARPGETLPTNDQRHWPTVERYRLLQRIGEGGCGTVYLAEQELPVRRQVALKVIKPGMDSHSVMARFDQERQALAILDHANIARIFDAGTTCGGYPYFAMEFVQGERITAFCDEQRLNLEQRLRLFIQVCQAIQHAHQKGIIHRDIKPSNILVSVQNCDALPKVIDFGIAKATGGRLGERTIYTELSQFLGTPAYMSPEQARLAGVDVDTRSDIYSLGVLLYELLTGVTPLDAAALGQLGIDEMRRHIADVEPPRPSVRLATFTEAEIASVSRQRSSEPLRLIQEIRGDLDWIVMQCLEKDRSRRYATANGLASDLQRHLTNELVQARPPTTVYRFQKAYRRNRAGMLAVGFAAATISTALGISLWMYAREARSRAASEHLLARSEVETGWAQYSRGDHRGAMASFTEALRLDGGNPGRERVHRLRLAAMARSQPRLKACWSAGKPATAAAIRVDIHRIALATAVLPDAGEVIIWDCDKATVISGPMRHGGPVRRLAFSPDGHQLAAASEDGKILIWETDTGTAASRSLSLGQPAEFLLFSPDGKKLLAGSSSGRASAKGSMALWDSQTGAELWREEVVGGSLRTAAFSPDGGSIAIGSYTYAAFVADTVSGNAYGVPNCWRANAVAFSPDGKRLLIGGAFREDGAETGARILDLGTRTYSTPLLSHRIDVRSVCFSPNGKQVATGGFDHTVQIWDAVTGTPINGRLPHTGAVTQLQYSPDGRLLLASDGDHTLRLWHVATGRPWVSALPHAAEIIDSQFSGDGTLVYSVAADGSVNAWSTEPAFPATVERHSGRRTFDAIIDPTGELYTVEAQGVAAQKLVGGNPPRRFPEQLSPFGLKVQFAAEGLLMGNLRGLTYLNTNTGTYHTQINPNPGEPWGNFPIFAGGRHTVRPTPDRTSITEVESATGRSIRNFDAGFVLSSVVLAPTGESLFGFGVSNGMIRWNIRTAEVEQRGSLGADQAVVDRAEFSPNGRWLLVQRTGDRPPELYSSTRLTANAVPVLLTSHAQATAFSPDSRFVATGTVEGVTRIHDTEAGSNRRALIEHQGAIFRLGFSPDGTLLFTGSLDRTARVWDVETGQAVTPPLIDEESPAFVGFGPDLMSAWTVSTEGRVRGWPLVPEQRSIQELHKAYAEENHPPDWDRAKSWEIYRDTLRASQLLEP